MLTYTIFNKNSSLYNYAFLNSNKIKFVKTIPHFSFFVGISLTLSNKRKIFEKKKLLE